MIKVHHEQKLHHKEDEEGKLTNKLNDKNPALLLFLIHHLQQQLVQ